MLASVVFNEIKIASVRGDRAPEQLRWPLDNDAPELPRTFFYRREAFLTAGYFFCQNLMLEQAGSSMILKPLKSQVEKIPFPIVSIFLYISTS
ncbi:hypothetical protein NDU88_003412 [Pleurodeles waltl]|uniref:Uncharacterized protein n=1 Tax=Pleurodeles waltl TaxID=8319 RepID=A0AAV7MU68_PLEWA|nr:hypothetical protein NDU88_003412 [Pleurodeles waltl]